jgi:hypothetical protein
VAALLGQPVERVDVIDRGHIANRRSRVTLADGTTVFVKEPTTPWTAAVLAGERRSYEAIGPRPFLPALIAAADDLLVVQHFDGAHWPPPWRPGDLAAALGLLDDIAAVPGDRALRDLDADDRHHVWSEVAADPEPFLALGACDRRWFERTAGALVATDGCSLAGTALVHGDLRSDNLGIVDGRAIAVDWGAAARGRPDYDRVTFAVTVEDEGAAPVDDVAPDADPQLVGVIAGVYARASASPHVPAPIRAQLQRYLRVALPWCARRLGLPPTS